MSTAVPRDGAGNEETAQATRERVVDVAHSLFVERGYRGTTVALVAERAAVTPEWVTRSFGAKEALVKAAFDVALAGDHADLPLSARPEAQAVRDQPTIVGKVNLYFRHAAARHRRSGPIQLVIRDEHRRDPALTLVWETVMEERLRAMRGFAEHLLEVDGVRTELDVEALTDVLWWATAVEHYDLLVRERGWSEERYAAWLAQVLVTSLT